VTWDLPQALVDWAQVAGAALSLAAIVVALFALWRQRADILRERRAYHDLELLRELTRHVANPRGYIEADVLISMLPEGGPNIEQIRTVLAQLRLDDEVATGGLADDERECIWRASRREMLQSIKMANDWRVNRIDT
jgi:hypothetical protein